MYMAFIGAGMGGVSIFIFLIIILLSILAIGKLNSSFFYFNLNILFKIFVLFLAAQITIFFTSISLYNEICEANKDISDVPVDYETGLTEYTVIKDKSEF